MVNTRRFLGDLDADKDSLFKSHFVESTFLSRIKNNDSDIIYGLKGVGKTALRRALTEIESDHFYCSKVIDLSSISFETLLKALVKLNDTTSIEMPNLARCVWMNNLIHYGLEALAENIKDNSKKERIISILKKEKFINPNSKLLDNANLKILTQVERIFDYIIEFGIEEPNANHHLDLTPKQLDVSNTFPLNSEIYRVLKDCESLFSSQSKKIVICLDGFDSIVDHKPESRKAIFAGLIDSIFRFRSDKTISQIFCFKAFLPKELTVDAESIVWDSDKYAYNVHTLKWNRNEFEHFLEKRLFSYSKKRSSKFSDLWPEYMPDKLINSVHNVEENTFEYILRHTLGRPRQVLLHMQKILDRWDEKYIPFKVDPSFIPSIVAESNIEMARQVASQLQIVYPNMQSFLRSWFNSSCVMKVAKFKEKLQTYFSELTVPELNKLVDDLYNFGLFGFLGKKEFKKQLGKKYFRFGFTEDVTVPNLQIDAKEDDYLAFAPMFREYCGFNDSEHGIIMTNKLK